LSGLEGTVRERILRLLLNNKGRFFTVDEIIVVLGLDIHPREVYRHLEHIAKTVRRMSNGRLLLVMKPPRCLKCGYVFKDLKRPRKPSRCPRCHSERISDPEFAVIER
jgi:predicted Zn-ribbon and HTH transcriptional regulator